jgi:cytochrome c biogenesis protein CcdA/thiol-disulfide isomerase/thioredoxin
MLALIGIGFIGGLITGISPCILPILPVIFFAGAAADTPGTPSETTPSGADSSVARRDRARPYRVIAGLVVSFSLVTLAGTALLSLLHLPQDTIRWVALIALIAIGLGLIFPRFEELLEKPFARLPARQANADGGGFTFGLALGALYVPCAGPVLAAIVVAGATHTIGVGTVALTLSFAAGTALPLLVFALAGERVAQRVGAFRSRQRTIRIVAGVVTILLAVGLVFNLPAAVQRAIPDYTHRLQDKVASPSQLAPATGGGSAPTACSDGGSELQNCGPAPDFAGITAWFNTPGNAPISLKSLRGKVVLIDFWAYSCINCQRAITHVENWYHAYHDQGLEVIGVHTPEYAFEHVEDNVRAGAADLGITYPVALDNDYATWTKYHNNYWPAEYLIDAQGNIRHTKFGEGDYAVTEKLIRQLLSEANATAQLPPTTAVTDQTPHSILTPETYLGAHRAENYGGPGDYRSGTFDYPTTLPDDKFALRGRWTIGKQSITAEGQGATMELNYHGRNVYLVVGGTGTLTVTRNGQTTTVPVSGAPNMRTVVSGDDAGSGHVEITSSPGLQAYSFTFG